MDTSIKDASFPGIQAEAAVANPLAGWILTEAWDFADAADVVKGFAQTMVAMGMAISRLRVSLRTLHPQFIGVTYTWRRAEPDTVEEFLPPISILQEERYLKSPYAPIFEGAGGIRRRLDIEGAVFDFPILTELRAEGATDYVALPMLFSDGRINAVTVAADRAGGFTTGELQRISESMALLGRLFEVHVLRRTARTILETYLGHLTGERVLDGQIKRGDGEDMHAVIWFCDLRGSTKLAERLPRSQYLALLNEYFEAMAGAVLANGGEVLSYIGDAVLAIFPIGAPGDCVMPCPRHVKACELALAAAMDAMGRMDALNGDRAAKGERPLRFGIALHLGDVMYGNIGVPERLSFTVIGSATNQASRIESMTKVLDKQLLVSSAIADVIPGRLVSLGFHALRGVSEPCEIFTLP